MRPKFVCVLLDPTSQFSVDLGVILAVRLALSIKKIKTLMGLAFPLAWIPNQRPHVTWATLLWHVSPVPSRYLLNCSSSSISSRGSRLLVNMTESPSEFRTNFIQVLKSRRNCSHVLLSVEHGKPVENPMYQKNPPQSSKEAMESCPRKEIEDFKEKLVEENLYLNTEVGEQGRLPILILSLKNDENRKRPAIVFLHSSYVCKEWLRPLLEAYASRGYVSIAIDSRYHGERAKTYTTYLDVLVSAWRNGLTMPFIFDTVWDLIKLADYLVTRDDIDPCRIGITGESLGGMHAWFAAAADTRYSVVVPIIGIQGFRWAIENNKWQARADSIKPLFEAARIDLGKNSVDKEVVEKAWDRIAPGLDSQFDAPFSVPIIAPRPLLILNGADDPRCPLLGLETPKERAMEAYENLGSPEKFKLIAERGIGHQMSANMVKEASDWFDKFM